MTDPISQTTASATTSQTNDYSPIEIEVKQFAEQHATEIDTNQNQEVTWHEMRAWALANPAKVPTNLQGYLTGETPKGFSWQKIAKDTGSDLHNARDGGTYYTYNYPNAADASASDASASDASASDASAADGTNPAGQPTATFTLPTITEDDVSNQGVLVSEILAGQASDVDNGATIGIAIAGANAGNGAWEYSTDNGATWNSLGDVSDTAAAVLRPGDRVRFLPDQKNGTSADFTFHAWNPGAEKSGDKVDASQNGGTTAFSVQTGIANITVSDVNDAPVLGATSSAGNPGDNESSTNHAPVLEPGSGGTAQA